MENNPRVYAFIDSQNLNKGTQKMGWKMDWRKFRDFLQVKYGVSHAFMFIGFISGNEDLYNQLHDSGYKIILKPTVEHKTTDDQQVTTQQTKGNVDVELVLYALKEMSNYDKCIIVSGDGDFFSLVEYLEKKDRLAHIMAPNWQYSSLLKPYEKYVVRLDKLRRELAYRDRRKTNKN
ncbi:MAG TPA: NYN domain-containing protein [Candidatus Saccharimonadales bacterium]|nr:NYN domain-containing protein [Candidatus Saccharimonadales bacterium]